jgi:putative ABC transport system substrate-binding protein
LRDRATGVSFLIATLADKRLEVLRELVPQSTTIAVLANTKSPVGMRDLQSLRSVAAGLGLQLQALDASTAAEFEAAFSTAADNGAGALVVAADPFFYSHRDQIVALAGRHRLPAIYHDRDFARIGGLMSYGASVSDAYRLMGLYVVKFLRGANPIDLPVVQPTQFVLSINLQTARILGIEVPPTLLARADEVIE